jgi:hypothetical protein
VSKNFSLQEVLEAAYRLEEIYSQQLLWAIILGRPRDILVAEFRLMWVQDTIVYLERFA